MTKERNIKLYYAAYRYLEQIKPEGVRLEDYFYGDNRDYTSLKEVYRVGGYTGLRNSIVKSKNNRAVM